MDRLSHLRDEAGGSRDSSLDSSVSPAYLTANEDSSKYFSLSEIDSSAEVSAAAKDVTLTMESPSEGVAADTTRSDNSTIGADKFSIQNEIDAANILSGGVNIFDDHDNSPDGNNLVIDDNVELDTREEESIDHAPTDENMTVTDSTSISNLVLNSESTAISPNLSTKPDESGTANEPITMPDAITMEPKQIEPLQEVTDNLIPELSDKKSEAAVTEQNTEVVLLIDGNNVNAIDIGNGMYLYRRQNDGEEDLAAVQILNTEDSQPTFKFLKVRENAEGNLEVIEEIVEPTKDAKEKDKNTPDKSSNVALHVTNKVQNEVEIKPNKTIIEDQQNDKLTGQEMASDMEAENKSNEGTKPMKFGSEARKSPIVGSFTPMTFHSTPNKEGVPLTKTMVDLQLHPNKLPDMAKKTIELTTDSSKNKQIIAECSKIEKVSDDVVLDVMCKPLVEQIQDNKQSPNTKDVKITEVSPNLKCNDIIYTETIKIDESKAKESKVLLFTEKPDKCNTSISLQDHTVLGAGDSVKSEAESKPVNNAEAETKSINNNHAVPFGKWTGADRKEFLNKIKESKPTNVNSNQNQIKKPNDLNRRDFLKKIDNARQNLNTQKKDFANPAKSILQSNIPKSTSFQLHVPETRFEAAFTESFPPNDLLIDNNKKDSRTEMNNQDLIDKTIMDIMEKLPSKSSPEPNSKEINKPSLEKTNILVCDNVEQPLITKFDSSKLVCYGKASKTYLKKSNSDNQNPIASNKISQDCMIDNKPKDEEQSEEEILEHEPVTADSQPKSYLFNSLSPNKSVEKLSNDSNNVTLYSDKPTIITENEFDKFARRNSVTLENQLTLVAEKNTEHHYSQSVLNVPKSTYTTQIYNKTSSNHSIPVKVNELTNDESQRKSYSSQVQIAYHSLTANRQKESIIAPFDMEDRKVEVLYVDSTNEFIPYNLNAQGPQLTSNILEVRDTESGTLSSCDSIDSDFLDSVDYPNTKHSGESKLKTKHPRKQVLNPVETPELELIEPDDLGHDVTSKRKRKTEDFNRTKNQDDKYSKSLLPKKTYLFGRNTQAKKDLSVVASQEPDIKVLKNSNISDYTKDVSSNLDSLVKAAELIENQPDVVKTLVSLQSKTIPVPQTSPMKRGRGRPRKYPLTDDSRSESMSPSFQKKTNNHSTTTSDITGALTDQSADESDDTVERKIKENWTMGKINENILCPICNKLFRSEEVVYKHVQHCTKASEKQKKLLQKRRSFRNSRSDLFEIEKNETSVFNKNKIFENKNDKVQNVHKTKVHDNVPEKDELKNKVCDTENRNVDKPVLLPELPKNELKDIIVIEDTPEKLQKQEKEQDETKNKQNVSTKTVTRPGHSINNHVCPICGKTFRQMSYLIHHKLLHKNESKTRMKQVQDEPESKSVFVCEVCSKKFRKLHHLVQHREIHNQDNARPKRRSLEEPDKKPVRPSVSSNVDSTVIGKGAGFRCERCDKSFRKLHHLVEHRETHDGVGKTKSVGSVQKVDTEKDKSTQKDTHPPPQCSICKKTFRKLHHLSEHKETHLNEKKGLSSKDIIHECPMCYMVFPNDYSLEKHIIICKRKRRQAAAKRNAEGKATDETPSEAAATEADNDEEDVPVARLKAIDKTVCEETRGLDTAGPSERSAGERKRLKSQETKLSKLKRNSSDFDRKKELETPAKLRRVEEAVTEPLQTVKTDALDKKALGKEISSATVTKSKPPATPSVIQIDSDDEEARYMLNPKHQHHEDMFHAVRAHKRSSLQIERRSKPAVPRRVSLPPAPRPPPRLRSVAAAATRRSVPSPGSDDSDTKYSFPPEQPKQKLVSATVTKPRKSAVERRTPAVKRLSVGKTPIPKPQVAKPKKQSAEYRCDCGAVFAAATLLARHTSLAHTPPRRLRTDPARHPAKPARATTIKAKRTTK